MKHLLTACLLLGAGAAVAGELSPGLQRQLADTPGDPVLRVLVTLDDRVDVAALDQRLHVERATRARRHAEVALQLREAAERSQPPLLEALGALRAQGKVRGWTPHWLVNAVVVSAPASVVPELASLPGVDVVEADLVPELIEPVAIHPAEGSDRDGERTLIPGLTLIEAERVWYELGITGEGALVANMDTGVHYQHQALNARWRGNFAPADECWQDAWGASSTPHDENGHGSHTMGTITGLAPGDSIGVCPGALWIATNVIASGTGAAFDNAVIAGFEWLGDPDGDPFTLADVPDVVQNSWGVNESFSGYVDCDSRWWDAIDACEALGVAVTWSAGNEGPGSTTMRSPGDRAASPTSCFSVGSCTTNNSNPTISSFSSRGPSGCGGLYPTKPEVTAPGQGIRSVQAGTTNGYVNMDGTSMAGPHVAGIVGLMRSANPDLDVISIKEILMETAVDKGTVGDDNTWGMGLVNAYEAVLASLADFGTVAGTVVDAASQQPLENVLVLNQATGQSGLTGDDGFYSLLQQAGEVELTYTLFGYVEQSVAYTVVADETVAGDVELAAVPSATVGGFVRDAAGLPVEGALVEALGEPIDPAVTAVDGSWSLTLPLGAYSLRSSLPGTGWPLGPDEHGYRAYDASDLAWDEADVELTGGDVSLDFAGPALPAWDWTTLDPLEDGPGTAIDFSGGDDLALALDLPFDFVYYGQTFDRITICSNGWFVFGDTDSVTWANGLIPDPAKGPPAMVAPFWEDLSPQQAGSGSISWWNGAGRFVLEFNHVRQYAPATAFETFQVELRDPAAYPTPTGDGQILLRYGPLSDQESVTVGIESPDGTDGLMAFHSFEDTGVDEIDGCPPLQEGLQFVFSTGFLEQQIVLEPVDDLVIDSGDALQTLLSWSPAAGATRYRVERSPSLDGDWELLGTTTSTSWSDPYQLGVRIYRVVAENDE